MIIMILLVVSLGITVFNTSNEILVFNRLPDKDLLRKFLESQYIEEAGLLRAAAKVYSENVTIYVANDNVLGARALAVLGSPLAGKVLTTLNNVYQGGFNERIEVLLGIDIPDTFYDTYKEYIGEVNGYTILYEKMNKSVILNDWYEYADLLVYRGLDSLLEGSRSEAEESFINMTKMWDGYGFYDKFVRNYEEKYNEKPYQVYKCALFVYLYRALYYADSDVIRDYDYILDKCLEIIDMAQDPVYGGIYTDYEVVNGEIVILKGKGRDMNTETTSMVVLALFSNYPELIGERAKSFSFIDPASYGYQVGTIAIPYTLALVSLAFAYRIIRKLL